MRIPPALANWVCYQTAIFAILIVWKNISVEFCFTYWYGWASFLIFESYLSFFWGVVCSCSLPIFLLGFQCFFRISGGSFYIKVIRYLYLWCKLQIYFYSSLSIFWKTYMFLLLAIKYLYIFLFLMDFEPSTLIHLEFILVYGVRYWYNFIFLQVTIQLSQHYLFKNSSNSHWFQILLYHVLHSIYIFGCFLNMFFVL